MKAKPRVLFVGRTRYELPLSEPLARKWDALGERLDLQVVGIGEGGDGRFELHRPLRPSVLDYLVLPFRLRRAIRTFAPDAISVENPHLAVAALAARRLAGGRGPRVVVDVHGDWRRTADTYGSRARRLLGPLANRVALAGIRRADAVRTISQYTADLVREAGVEPAAVVPTWTDLGAFLRPPVPLPERRRALFVGALEPAKGIDTLGAAWRLVATRLPDAELHVVGSGSRARLVEELGVRWDPSLSPPEVARALDEAMVLVLPSRTEGLGRVAIEALCRGRPVVGSRVGGIADVVEHDATGLLVEPDDPDALADALVRALSDRALAERLAAAARPAAERWVEAYARYPDAISDLMTRS